MNVLHTLRWLSISLCVVLVFGMSALAQEPDAAPDAKAFTQKAMTFFSNLDSMSVDLAMGLHVERGDKIHDRSIDAHFALRGEKEVYLTLKDPKAKEELFGNGETITIYHSAQKNYMVHELAQKRWQTTALLGGDAFRPAMLMIAYLVHNESTLFNGVDEVKYIGQEACGDDGSLCDHVRLIGASQDVDLWLAVGDEPLPRRLQVVLDKQYLAPGAQKPVLHVEIRVDLTNWTVNTILPDDMFTFTPPEGVTRKLSQEEIQERAAHRGKPAPQVELDLLGGGKLDLAAHKGKNIVILDFFATWCPPCRVAMPILAQIAQDYADKNVVLYGINQGEAAERVQALLDNMKLSMTVALDKNAQYGKLYGVQGIPHMVIIDKEGVVRQVHRGAPENLKEEVKKDLDALLEEG